MQTGMRTAVLKAPRRFGMADRPKPVAGSGEVEVKTDGAAQIGAHYVIDSTASQE